MNNVHNEYKSSWSTGIDQSNLSSDFYKKRKDTKRFYEKNLHDPLRYSRCGGRDLWTDVALYWFHQDFLEVKSCEYNH